MAIKPTAFALRASVALLTLMLGGCFVSEKPFITPQNADYPLKDGTKLSFYTVHFWNGGTDREQDKTNRVKIVTVGEAPARGPAAIPLPPPGRYYGALDGKTGELVLFKHFDGAFYIVEALMRNDKKQWFMTVYSLASIEGGEIKTYPTLCHPFDTDSEFVRSGLLHATKDESSFTRCTFANLQDLETVFRARLAGGMLANGGAVER